MKARLLLPVAALLLLPACRRAAGPPESARAETSGIAMPVTEETALAPGYPVGAQKERPQRILKTIDGQETLLLTRWDDPMAALEVPVEALRLVNPRAAQTRLGKCCGPRALRVGQGRPRNRLFYRNPRVACAAYTAYILRHCGRPGGSFSATAQYWQLRQRGGKLVASQMSTRYVPYFKYLRSGDFIFFHKAGGRIGHEEIYVGNGKVSGTSSSEGRVGIRRLGNRGFRLCTVVRI